MFSWRTSGRQGRRSRKWRNSLSFPLCSRTPTAKCRSVQRKGQETLKEVWGGGVDISGGRSTWKLKLSVAGL